VSITHEQIGKIVGKLIDAVKLKDLSALNFMAHWDFPYCQ